MHFLDSDFVSGSSRRLSSTSTTIPAALPLGQVGHIWSMAEAQHICEILGVGNEHMQHLEFDGIYVIWIDPKKEAPDLDLEIPHLDQILIIACPAEQHLAETLHACKDYVGGNWQLAQGEVTRMDDISLVSFDSLFEKSNEYVSFDITLRPSSSVRSVAVCAADCRKSMMGGQLAKLQYELFVVDMMRVTFIVREAVSLRLLFLSVEENLKPNLMEFISNWSNIQHALPDSFNLHDRHNELLLMEHSQKLEKGESAEGHYLQASSRAMTSALLDLYTLELQFHVVMEGQAGTYRPPAWDAQIEKKRENEYVEVDSDSASAADQWCCPSCTYVNSASDTCEICGARRDSAPALISGRSAVSWDEQDAESAQPETASAQQLINQTLDDIFFFSPRDTGSLMMQTPRTPREDPCVDGAAQTIRIDPLTEKHQSPKGPRGGQSIMSCVGGRAMCGKHSASPCKVQ